MRLWHFLLGAPFVSWNDRVKVLKSETPLRLPPIRPLKARKAKKGVKREMRTTLFRKRA